ncbi:hypothetical protein HPB52_006399 [Rhipicephalus sanguineus]|uniref:Uncharacterized protein n=1 Tax=Rhipicephalus sanguineus TaxID=34632 RepID=A0A9D4PYT4_RHISA|nr:hypothetical protein HPB52_006399 [Rhipicephalus sanguineus]
MSSKEKEDEDAVISQEDAAKIDAYLSRDERRPSNRRGRGRGGNFRGQNNKRGGGGPSRGGYRGAAQHIEPWVAPPFPMHSPGLVRFGTQSPPQRPFHPGTMAGAEGPRGKIFVNPQFRNGAAGLGPGVQNEGAHLGIQPFPNARGPPPFGNRQPEPFMRPPFVSQGGPPLVLRTEPFVSAALLHPPQQPSHHVARPNLPPQHFPPDLIKRLTSYYGLALRSNTDVEDMKKAVMATFHNVSSTDAEPHQELCPSGARSWCRHRAAEAEGKPQLPHTYNLPNKVVEALRPVYQHLSDPQLQARCSGNKTQNAAESLHSPQPLDPWRSPPTARAPPDPEQQQQRQFHQPPPPQSSAAGSMFPSMQGGGPPRYTGPVSAGASFGVPPRFQQPPLPREPFGKRPSPAQPTAAPPKAPRLETPRMPRKQSQGPPARTVNNANIKEVPILDYLPPPEPEKATLPPAIEEDAATQELRRKIEEQKKLREQVMRIKEERRKLAVMQRQKDLLEQRLQATAQPPGAPTMEGGGLG